jgi:hypothetical protein
VALFVAVAPDLGSGRRDFWGRGLGTCRDQVRPRIADTAEALLVIYLALTFGGPVEDLHVPGPPLPGVLRKVRRVPLRRREEGLSGNRQRPALY